MSEPVIGEDGAVTIDGRQIGRVYKGTRTYSPPLYKGSRVAQYHKQVPCWWGSSIHPNYMNFNRKTRRAVIERLMEMDKDA